MPKDEASDEDYRARCYDAYLTTHAGSEAPNRGLPALKKNVLSRISADPAAQILDVGCGQGTLMEAFVSDGYKRVEGVDTSLEQIAVARSKGLVVTQANIFDFLSDKPSHYDVITAMDVLEHFDKPQVLELIDLLAFALKPGGQLIGQVPNGQSPFGGRYIYGDFTHGTGFTQRSIAQVLRVGGFQLVDVFSADPVAHGAVSAVRAVLWKLVAGLYKAALAIETGVLSGHVVTQNLIFGARTTQDTDS